MEFKLLSAVEALHDGEPVDIGPARQRCALALLLVSGDHPLTVDSLTDRLWGEHPPSKPAVTIRSYLSRLRSALPADGTFAIERGPVGYLARFDPASVDLHRFRFLVGQARGGPDEESAQLLVEALALWRGEPFAGLDNAWLDALRRTLEQERDAAQLDLHDVWLRTGQHGNVLTEIPRQIAARPLDERLAGQFMLALYRNGRQDEALAHFHRVRMLLADELGADPSADLARLHGQILAHDAALTPPSPAVGVTSAPATVRTPRQLPAGPRLFIGRDAELAQMTRTVDEHRNQTDPAMTLLAIAGAGGMGKTWLTLAWAHRNLQLFPDGQLHVDLRGYSATDPPLSTGTVIRGFLEALGVPTEHIPTDDDARTSLYRTLMADRRMLLVLDNARDADTVTALLPGTPTVTVLATSRQRLGALVATHDAVPITLDTLDPNAARELLIRRVGDERLATEPAAADELLRYCAGLPLALGVVAARAAHQTQSPLAGLAEELREAAHRLAALSSDDLTISLRAVLESTCATLSPEARTLFVLLGAAPGDDISLAAISCLSGLSGAGPRTAVRELTNTFLLSEDRPKRYSMHALVRAYATELAEKNAGADQDAALARLTAFQLELVARTRTVLSPSPRLPEILGQRRSDSEWPDFATGTEALVWLDTERANLISTVRWLVRNNRDDDVWRLAWLLMGYYRTRQLTADWVEVAEHGMRSAERLPDTGARFHAANILGGAYGAVRRWEEAIVVFEEALQISTDMADSQKTAMMLTNIGMTLEEKGDPRAGIDYLEAALAKARSTGLPGADATPALNLSECYLRVGRYTEALEHAELAHAKLTDREFDYAATIALCTIAEANHQLGRLADALDHGRRAATRFEQFGTTIDAAKNDLVLGRIQYALDNRSQARAHWRSALTTFSELNDPRADDVASLLEEYADD